MFGAGKLNPSGLVVFLMLSSMASEMSGRGVDDAVASLSSVPGRVAMTMSGSTVVSAVGDIGDATSGQAVFSQTMHFL